MKITVGIPAIVRGRPGLYRVAFTRTAGANWSAEVISGHNLSSVGAKKKTVTPEQYDEIFSDHYNTAANAKRALALWSNE